MFNIAFILHKSITNKQLAEIISIKSIAWPHNFDSQLDWINSNIKDEDIHALLFLNESLIAYLNLIEIEFKLDGKKKKGYGIGNVCVKEKGKGWGKEIMTKTNLYLAKKKIIGLLFCKSSLVNFYSLNNCLLIDKQNVTLAFDNKLIETMIFNSCEDFHNIEYLGKPF